MQLSTTFRHMDASKAVREHAEQRLERVRKYFQRDPIAAHAVFTVERGHNHTAEFNLTLPNGLVIQARETTEDMYSSIDLAGARIERQVRKWKEKIQDHKPHDGSGIAARTRVLSAEAMEPQRGQGHLDGFEDGAPARALPPAGNRDRKAVTDGRDRPDRKVARPDGASPTPPPAPAISVIKEQTFTVRTMRVEDAVMQMNLLENDFYLFTDVDSQAVSVVYRRKDGNYGLIETGGRLPSS